MIKIIINKSFKTRIYPNKDTIELFNKAFNARRFLWNWSLEQFLNDSIYKKFDLSKKFNSIKNKEYPWINEIWSALRQEVFKDFNLSVSRYFSEQKKARKKLDDVNTDFYKPKFKKKGKSLNTFRMCMTKHKDTANPVEIESKHHISVGGIRGVTKSKERIFIKTKESLLFLRDKNKYKLCEATFTERNGKYYVSISYEIINHQPNNSFPNEKVGIDMGVKNPLTCYDSNNEYFIFDLPKELSKVHERTKKLQKLLSNKKFNSNNYTKAKIKVNKSLLKERNIKDNFRKETIDYLTYNYKTIIIEDFNITGFGKYNKSGNIKLQNIGIYTFMEKLKSKCNERGNELILIPKFTPTTQTCSKCNYRLLKNERLNLNSRKFLCPKCGFKINRDVNSAINIFNYKD